MHLKLRDKIFIGVCVLLCGIAIYAGIEEDPYANVDQKEVYQGFTNIPDDYTPEEAVKDGCLVYNQNELFGGEEVWNKFYATVQEHQPADVRVMQVINQEGDFYFEDLFYDGSKFELYNSLNPYKYHYTYKYLLNIEGTPENKTADVRFVIITDDKDVTFKQLHKIRHSRVPDHSLDYQMIFFE